MHRVHQLEIRRPDVDASSSLASRAAPAGIVSSGSRWPAGRWYRPSAKPVSCADRAGRSRRPAGSGEDRQPLRASPYSIPQATSLRPYDIIPCASSWGQTPGLAKSSAFAFDGVHGLLAEGAKPARQRVFAAHGQHRFARIEFRKPHERILGSAHVSARRPARPLQRADRALRTRLYVGDLAAGAWRRGAAVGAGGSAGLRRRGRRRAAGRGGRGDVDQRRRMDRRAGAGRRDRPDARLEPLGRGRADRRHDPAARRLGWAGRRRGDRRHGHRRFHLGRQRRTVIAPTHVASVSAFCAGYLGCRALAVLVRFRNAMGA